MNKHRSKMYVGTCGFAEAQQRLFHDFTIVEVQQTFYQPPRVSTAERWRSTAPKDFVFTLKAWQLITHEASSPSYRRLKEPLSDQALAQCGDFKWNAVTQMAWERTVTIADALNAKAVVFQTPERFLPTDENLQRMKHFFQHIERHHYRFVFEPRGEAWRDDLVRQIITELDLVHAVDPFLRNPVGRGLRYFRLHGKPAYHYHYQYTNQDLQQLQTMLSKNWPNYILFNNDSMAYDAQRFLKRLANGKCL
jgi:uncharacterized protein YecE (DUF72 family)